ENQFLYHHFKWNDLPQFGHFHISDLIQKRVDRIAQKTNAQNPMYLLIGDSFPKRYEKTISTRIMKGT
ncbi:MAG TPA: hypothetical protein VGQ55_10625, partial [Pyrinomonadaceae bacterium]|nr:hypothetical protein [Pyrinomonadaceae bacterium]